MAFITKLLQGACKHGRPSPVPMLHFEGFGASLTSPGLFPTHSLEAWAA